MLRTDCVIIVPFLLQSSHNFFNFIAIKDSEAIEPFLVLLDFAINVGNEGDFFFIDGLDKSDERDTIFDVIKDFDTDSGCDEFVVGCFQWDFSDFIDEREVEELSFGRRVMSQEFAKFLVMTVLVGSRDDCGEVFSEKIIFAGVQEFTKGARDVLNGLNKPVFMELR